jgi:hypothetical protein
LLISIFLPTRLNWLTLELPRWPALKSSRALFCACALQVDSATHRRLRKELGEELTAEDSEPPFHLLLEAHQIDVTGKSLRLLISDEAHERQIRSLARDVLARLDGELDEHGILSVELGSRQMKITHTALRSLYRDLGRDEASERDVVREVLDKLPDEHTMRAITLD